MELILDAVITNCRYLQKIRIGESGYAYRGYHSDRYGLEFIWNIINGIITISFLHF